MSDFETSSEKGQHVEERQPEWNIWNSITEAASASEKFAKEHQAEIAIAAGVALSLFAVRKSIAKNVSRVGKLLAQETTEVSTVPLANSAAKLDFRKAFSEPTNKSTFFCNFKNGSYLEKNLESVQIGKDNLLMISPKGTSNSKFILDKTGKRFDIIDSNLNVNSERRTSFKSEFEELGRFLKERFPTQTFGTEKHWLANLNESETVAHMLEHRDALCKKVLFVQHPNREAIIQQHGLKASQDYHLVDAITKIESGIIHAIDSAGKTVKLPANEIGFVSARGLQNHAYKDVTLSHHDLFRACKTNQLPAIITSNNKDISHAVMCTTEASWGNQLDCFTQAFINARKIALE